MPHTTYFERHGPDDEVQVIETTFTLTGGHPGSRPSFNHPGDPPEPPEFEIVEAIDTVTGATVTLTSDEEYAVMRDVFDRLGDFEGGDYPEDF